MPVILYLLFAHFLIDWCLQSDFIAQNKHKMWQIMTAHVAAWSLGICVALSYFGLFAWWKLAFLFIGHYGEDLYKAKMVAKVNEENTMLMGERTKYFSKLLNYDQGCHILQLCICLLP